MEEENIRSKISCKQRNIILLQNSSKIFLIDSRLYLNKCDWNNKDIWKDLKEKQQEIISFHNKRAPLALIEKQRTKLVKKLTWDNEDCYFETKSWKDKYEYINSELDWLNLLDYKDKNVHDLIEEDQKLSKLLNEILIARKLINLPDIQLCGLKKIRNIANLCRSHFNNPEAVYFCCFLANNKN